MRIEQVTAYAFGPLTDKTLTFAPGMTVVYGQNEAGKSSWHAALYAGLCGVRRGKGQPLLEDRLFRDLHKPWDAERWEVEARVRLEDGRRIELRQDLAGRVACRATDLGLGVDVSSEIMFDGSPDASVWLGLDRRAFRATACIEQAELLAIADDPDRLQEYIQRAAATRGTDATATAAIDRLAEFRRAQVGEDRANSTKPLRRARVGQETASAELASVRARHADYLDLVAAADGARHRADRAEAAVRPLIAAVAARRAEAARRDADRAAELSVAHPSGPPSGIVARDELSDRVAGALDAWDRRPSPVALDGESADALTDKLARLPALPTGDLSLADEVVRARTLYDRRLEALQLVGDRPTVPSGGPPEPLASGGGQPRAGRVRTPLWVASAGFALLGVVLAVAGATPAGFALLVLAAAAAVGALLRPSGRAADGVDPKPKTVAGPTGPTPEQLTEWERLDAERRAALTEAEASLRALLEAHGTAVVAADTIDDAYDRYRADCQTRATLAGEASGGATLQAAVAARRDLERSSVEVDRRLAAIDADLRRVAIETGADPGPEGAPSGGSASLAEDLRAWQARRSAAHAADEAAMREWQELETLLGGRTLDDLRAEADRLAERARTAAAGLELDAVAQVDPGHDPEATIARLEAEAGAARVEAERIAGRSAEVERGLPSVAEAEERLAAAETELYRVVGLDRVLQATLGLLRQAEARIHRDLAPVLGAAITAELARVSNGRYIEATVNPADLAVRVKAADGGRWREARHLSHGTREQIYLLLRLAMTDQLVTPAEIAPLLCDEVTVQSDQVRAFELLDLLHESSRSRQVVLFSHDERALAWAETHLTGEADRLIRLASAGAPA